MLWNFIPESRKERRETIRRSQIFEESKHLHAEYPSTQWHLHPISLETTLGIYLPTLSPSRCLLTLPVYIVIHEMPCVLPCCSRTQPDVRNSCKGESSACDEIWNKESFIYHKAGKHDLLYYGSSGWPQASEYVALNACLLHWCYWTLGKLTGAGLFIQAWLGVHANNTQNKWS